MENLQKHKIFIVAILILFFLGLIIFLILKKGFLQTPSGLTLTTTTPATVYLNGSNVGDTPYTNTNLRPTTYKIRLVPKDKNLSPWETSLKLSPKLTTVLHRSFSSPGGYLLSLKPSTSTNSLLTVITQPDSTKVSLNSEPLGISPLVKKQLKPRSYTLTLSHTGYKTLTIPLNLIKGYELIVRAELPSDVLIFTAPSQQESSASANQTKIATPSSQVAQSRLTPPYVVIQETGTGWLRVRRAPSTASEELGKVNVGEKLKFLDSNETGWYKVIFEGKEGWLSGRYVKLYK